ncbi:MAG: hypothetical protein J4O07_09310 [Chloroflexi bacterium]|nr:hypothetical protein [Chloroflexota bacterium]
MKTKLLLLASVLSLISAACGVDAQLSSEASRTPAVFLADELATATVPIEVSATPSPVSVEESATPGVSVDNPVTATVPVESATPQTDSPVIVGGLDLQQPSVSTLFEKLLSRIPDSESTRSYVRLTDTLTLFQLVGGEPIPVGASGDVRSEYWMDRAMNSGGDVRVPSPAWPRALALYGLSINSELYRTLGFDFVSAEQYVVAGVPPNDFEVAFGQYTPAATSLALAACDCEQPEIRQHAGVEYYAWGDGSGSISRRFNMPFYDDVGRGARLLIRDGEAYYSTKDGIVPELIDVMQGNASSLADVEDYVAAVRWMSALGTFGEMMLRDSHFSIDDVVKIGGFTSSVMTSPDGSVTFTDYTEEAFRRAAEKGPLLKPFSFVLSGSGFDGGKMFTGLVLAHADEASALANRARLGDRIRVGATFARVVNDEYKDRPWSELISRVELVVEGRFLIARLYAVELGKTFIQGLAGNTILTIHE